MGLKANYFLSSGIERRPQASSNADRRRAAPLHMYVFQFSFDFKFYFWFHSSFEISTFSFVFELPTGF